jgi:hypothetical protein
MTGFRFLVKDKLLLTLALQLGYTNMLGGPLFAVVLPVYANEIFHSATSLGLMAAARGGAELLGNVCYGWFGYRLSRRLLWLIPFLVCRSRFGSCSSTLHCRC